MSDDDRHRWLNDRVCTVEGEVQPRSGTGADVVLDVALVTWEPETERETHWPRSS